LHIKPEMFLPAVMGDRQALERAFSALVDNAVKFSPDGGKIEIRLRRKGDQVAVEISDQGIGIEQEDLPHIFERFYHVDKKGDRLFEGLGLGLAIAKQVIAQHKGRLDVISAPGKGSTFSMWLNVRNENGDAPRESGLTI
jgi:signal transduction histidine kinase